MRIALTIITYWPYIKRAGRYINGLAGYLIKQGHEITVITTKPGKSRKFIREGMRIVYNREYNHPLIPSRYCYQMYALPLTLSLIREQFDIVQSIYYIDGFSASVNKLFKGTDFVYFLTSDPYHLNSRIDSYMFRRTINSASAVVVPSRYIQESLRENYGLNVPLIPCGVDTSYFTPVPKKDLDEPKILCSAELGDSRKGVHLLIKAFELFKKTVPRAILQLSGKIHNSFAQKILHSTCPQIRDSIKILGVGKEEDIPALYANAAMTVLPSVQEAFGMVLIESLSAGTPVVGSRVGGIPDIIDDPNIGVLFAREGDQASQALCDAMLCCLELAKNPLTPSRCRQHSKRYDWNVVGRQLEDLYESVVYKP